MGRHGARRKIAKNIYSEKTLLERRRVLKQLDKMLDGPKAQTPCDDVERPKPPAATPVGVDITIVQRVATALEERARDTPLRSDARKDH